MVALLNKLNNSLVFAENRALAFFALPLFSIVPWNNVLSADPSLSLLEILTQYHLSFPVHFQV